MYSRFAGYEDVNNAERLAQAPSFRLVELGQIWDRGAAVPSRLQSFEALHRTWATYGGGWCFGYLGTC